MTDDLEPQDFNPEPQILPPQRPETGAGKKRLALIGAVVVVVAFGGYGWYAYDQGGKNGAILPPPLIKAEEGPAKVAPSEPGGMDVPYKDKLVYNRMSPGTVEEEAQDIIRSAEEPSSPAAAPEDVAPAPKLPGRSMAKAPPPAKMAAEKPASAKTAVAAGTYVVQLASFRARARAEKGWEALAKKHDDLLGFLSPDISRADLAAKGIFFRLRAGPFADRPAAAALCAQLKSRGVDCLVAKR